MSKKQIEIAIGIGAVVVILAGILLIWNNRLKLKKLCSEMIEYAPATESALGEIDAHYTIPDPTFSNIQNLKRFKTLEEATAYCMQNRVVNR